MSSASMDPNTSRPQQNDRIQAFLSMFRELNDQFNQSGQVPPYTKLRELSDLGAGFNHDMMSDETAPQVAIAHITVARWLICSDDGK